MDTSPVSKYITHPFWNWFVKVCFYDIHFLISAFLVLKVPFPLFDCCCCCWFVTVLSQMGCPQCADIWWFTLPALWVCSDDILWQWFLCLWQSSPRISTSSTMGLVCLCTMHVLGTHTRLVTRLHANPYFFTHEKICFLKSCFEISQVPSHLWCISKRIYPWLSTICMFFVFDDFRRWHRW